MFTRSSVETITINVNGTHVHVAIQPGDSSEPPLLLINGIGANLEAFDPFITALNKVRGKKSGRFALMSLVLEGHHPPSSHCASGASLAWLLNCLTL